MVKNRLGDRRTHVRFDVAGQLWAALDLGSPVVLRNIGLGGALVEAKLAPGLQSLRAAQLSLREHGPRFSVVVRHMQSLSESAEDQRYLLGLEFVHLSATAQSEVERLVQQGDEPAAMS